MQKIKNHFKKHDPLLHEWMLKIQPINKITPIDSSEYFIRLCGSIIGQQLSSKAGDTIQARFEKLFADGRPDPKSVSKISHEKLRAVGMSNAKAQYVKNLADAIINRTIRFQNLGDLDDETVIGELTKVKGIGRWTAEMFLMFALGREDVFSHGDLGLRKGLQLIYGLPSKPTIIQVNKIINIWSPYKSYASRILWMSLELK